MEKFYTCEEVADILGVAIVTVWKWIREGNLRAVKVGKNYRVFEKDINDFVKSVNH